MDKLKLNCAPLDELLGGGIEKCVITNVYGESGTGKTNFCIQAVKNALPLGKVMFIDTEGGFSVERFVQVCKDEGLLKKVILLEPKSFKEQKTLFMDIEKLVKKEKPVLIVVDSPVALYRLELDKKNAFNTNRELSIEMATLSKIARDYKIPVLVTNQVYYSFETDDLQLVGRDIPTYWSKCMIKLEKLGKGKRKAVLKKHRSRPEGTDAEFYITDKGLEGKSLRLF